MYCPRCGSPIASGVAFCSKCGQAISQTVQPRPGERTTTIPPGSPGAAAIAAGGQNAGAKKWLMIGGGALLGILAVLFLLKASGFLGKEGDSSGPVLIKQGNTAPPVLAKTGDVPVSPKMPQDVLEWLKHLERIEQKKKDLSLKQTADMKIFEQMIGTLGAGIGELDPTDQTGEGGDAPQDVTKGKFQDLKPDWDALIADFTSKPPPTECQDIADNYFKGLNEIPGMVGDVQSVLNQVQSDPSSAMVQIKKMQNRSYDSIDKPMAIADGEVQSICNKYETKKWFNIGDVGANMFGKF